MIKVTRADHGNQESSAKSKPLLDPAPKKGKTKVGKGGRQKI